jgi:hypothetical protein
MLLALWARAQAQAQAAPLLALASQALPARSAQALAA